MSAPQLTRFLARPRGPSFSSSRGLVVKLFALDLYLCAFPELHPHGSEMLSALNGFG